MSTTRPVVIVTGASRGIGAACAHELAIRGWEPVLFARGEAVHEVARACGGLAVQGSLTEPDDLGALVDRTLEQRGRIDGVVVSTGDPRPGDDLLAIPDEQWHGWLDLLYLNVVRLARLVTPVFEAQQRGSWVNIGSVDLREPSPYAPYSGTLRNAVAGFTKLYARRHAAQGIRMNVVSPSYAWDPGDDVGPWANADFGPVGRPATLREVATVVAFLLSDDASYVSGIDLKVDAASTSAAL